MTLAELRRRHETLGGRFFRRTRSGIPLADSLITSASGRYVLLLTRQGNRFGLWRFDTESAMVHALGTRARECTARLALEVLADLY